MIFFDWTLSIPNYVGKQALLDDQMSLFQVVQDTKYEAFYELSQQTTDPFVIKQYVEWQFNMQYTSPSFERDFTKEITFSRVNPIFGKAIEEEESNPQKIVGLYDAWVDLKKKTGDDRQPFPNHKDKYKKAKRTLNEEKAAS